MAINYYNIFRQKTGMSEMDNPWDDFEVEEFLTQAAFIVSRTYATPWATFAGVPETYKYPVSLLACIEYWWSQLSIFATKSDVNTGQLGHVSTTLFGKAMSMIEALQLELEGLDFVIEGSGDIIIGDLVKRSKFTGRLVPYAGDPEGDWTS